MGSNYQEFQTYWKQMRRYPLLREYDVRRIFSTMDKESAIEEVVLRNGQFVCLLANAWAYQAWKYDIDMMDLVGAGNLGLYKGTRKFKKDSGSYYRYVKNYIWSYLEAEIFKLCNYPRLEGKKLMKSGHRLRKPISLCEVVKDNGDDEPLLLQDVIPNTGDDNVLAQQEVNELLRLLRRQMVRGEFSMAYLIELRYGVGSRKGFRPLSLEATSKRLNLSKEGVRKIEARALKQLADLNK